MLRSILNYVLAIFLDLQHLSDKESSLVSADLFKESKSIDRFRRLREFWFCSLYEDFFSPFMYFMTLVQHYKKVNQKMMTALFNKNVLLQGEGITRISGQRTRADKVVLWPFSESIYFYEVRIRDDP
jgi:hypothetical protein